MRVYAKIHLCISNVVIVLFYITHFNIFAHNRLCVLEILCIWLLRLVMLASNDLRQLTMILWDAMRLRGRLRKIEKNSCRFFATGQKKFFRFSFTCPRRDISQHGEQSKLARPTVQETVWQCVVIEALGVVCA